MKRVNLRNYPFRLRLHFFPVLVWLCALLCVVFLFSRRSQRFEVIGIAQSQVHQIAATCTGRLTEVNVDLFEQVEAGQTLAVIDTILENEQIFEAELKSQLSAVLAEIEHLTAQLVPTQDILLAEEADREMNKVTETRRFVIDVEQARLQVLQLKAQIASDQVILEDLAIEVQITEDLLQQEAVSPYELQKAKVQYSSLSEKVEEYKRLLKQAENDLELAEQRLKEFETVQLQHPDVDRAIDVIRKEIGVQEKLMDGLLTQLEALDSSRAIELKAPYDGVVIQIQGQANQAILRRPGEDIIRRVDEVVQAGDTIMAVAELKPSEIVAYINESQLEIVKEKPLVEVIKNRPPEQIATCEVTYVGPVMELMPERLWSNPNVPQWGCPVVIKIPERLELVSGELVGVRKL
jgi:multidrug resistance efflux pump